MRRDDADIRLYSLADACPELGGISIWTLRKHIYNGTIKATKLGTRVFLRTDEIARIKAEGLPSLTSAEAVTER